MDDSAPLSYAEPLAAARKGMRSCLACRTAFPNRLGLMKHELQGCRKVKVAARN